ncbi:MAG: hypothetical protein K2W86_15575 [Sphingomonas sp.]|uniref:hypothetical protein n=1 Tax=Sphingomonas sp. TaxID=28214 RepID=UPI0026868DA1|nr:hypothetical protein [Sphingomonas sp.]
MTRSFSLGVATLAAMAITLVGCAAPAPTSAVAMAGNNAMDMPMPDGSAVDMAALPLYPGSKMVDMKIMPHEVDDMIDLAFDSPADPATVRAWYVDTLGKQGFTLKEDGTALAGTDADGKPIRIDVQPAPGGHSTGTVSKG